MKLAIKQKEQWVDTDKYLDILYNSFDWSKIASKSKFASPTKRSYHNADVKYIDKIKEDIVGRLEWKKTQNLKGNNSLNSIVNPADDFKILV